MKIRQLQEKDWPSVATIYEEGIQTGHATFEKSIPSWPEWDQDHLKECRFVIESDGLIVGWSALKSYSKRSVYKGVAELTIYIKQPFRGKGIGSKLLRHLIRESEQAGIWMLQAGIFPENTASIILHGNNGFRTVGIREKIGQMDGIWRDVVLMERRSKLSGV